MRCAKAVCEVVILILLATSPSTAKAPESPFASGRIAFIQAPESWDGFKIKFGDGRDTVASATFVSGDGQHCYDIVIAKEDKEFGRIKDICLFGFTRVGTVDLTRDGREELFLEVGGGGSGAHWVDLSLICPRKLELIGLSLQFGHQATDPIPKVSISDNFHKRSLRSEREFLVRLMHDYGYVGEGDILQQADNPRFAYYFWARDNGRVQDGKIKIRRYRGKPSHGSVEDELQDGNIRYIACFKAGVVAYDVQNDEHFVVFHPEDMYSWPTALKKAGPHLIIGTRGQGLAIVNLESLHLKRIPLHSQDDEVKRLEVGDSLIRINGSREIPFPPI